MTAIARALSSALLHFVWQGLAVTILTWIALYLLRRRSAALRYAVCCGALALLTILPAATMLAVLDLPDALPQNITLSAGAAGSLTPAPSPGPIDWFTRVQAWALPVWALGVALFSLRMVWGCTRIAALRRAGESAGDAMLAKFHDLAARMGVTRPVRLLLSTVTDSPSVTGWLRPVVMLPIAAVAGLTPEQLEAVLAHELAHIRRHDYLVNLLQMAAETLLFYHPAVWWISARIRDERELCCDDLAVRTCGGAIPYARALTALEKMRASRPALALGSTDGPLFYRIRRLVLGEREYGPSKLSGAIALSLGLACAALTVHWVHAQEKVMIGYSVDSQEEERGITVNTQGARVLHRTRVEYPAALIEKHVEGTVSVQATLDAAGNVVDARVVSGPTELRKVALASVLYWHFAPGQATQMVDISFHTPAKSETTVGEARANVLVRGGEGFRVPVTLTTPGPDGKSETKTLVLTTDNAVAREQTQLTEDFVRAELLEARRRYESLHTQANVSQEQLQDVRSNIQELESKLEFAHKVAEATARGREPEASWTADSLVIRANPHERHEIAGSKIASIEVRGLSDPAAKDLGARLPVRAGDILTPPLMERAMQVVRQFDEHLAIEYSPEPDGTIVRVYPAEDEGVRVRVRR